jgi:hypothetical protein
MNYYDHTLLQEHPPSHLNTARPCMPLQTPAGPFGNRTPNGARVREGPSIWSCWCVRLLLNPNRPWGTFRPFYATLVASGPGPSRTAKVRYGRATGDQLHGGASRLQRPGLRAPANRQSRERDHACAPGGHKWPVCPQSGSPHSPVRGQPEPAVRDGNGQRREEDTGVRYRVCRPNRCALMMW